MGSWKRPLLVRRLYSLVSKMDQFKNAIKDNDTDKALELKQEFDLDLKLALFDAIKEDEEAAIALIENSQRLTLSLSEKNEKNDTPLFLACLLKKPNIVKAILCQAKVQDIAINAKNKYGETAFINAHSEVINLIMAKAAAIVIDDGRTAFIYACENGLTDIVAIMLEMAQEVKIDLNAKSNRKYTGFIWACEKKHSEVINLIMAKAESLQIDLHCKDDFGESGFDIYPEHSKILQIKEDLNLLMKAIEENDFDQVQAIKRKPIDLNSALFCSIREDEELAIRMIDNSQRLALSLSETNEDKLTPLFLACLLKKPKIVKAIL